MSVYCVKCEAESAETARYCSACGHGLAGTPPEAEAPSQGTGGVDTIACPKCGKQIVPQWLYTGRKWMASYSGIGLEAHGQTRRCPLCGVDIDSLMAEEKARREESERKPMTGKEFIADKLMLLALGLLITLMITAFLMR